MQRGSKQFWGKILEKIQVFLSQSEINKKDFSTISLCT